MTTKEQRQVDAQHRVEQPWRILSPPITSAQLESLFTERDELLRRKIEMLDEHLELKAAWLAQIARLVEERDELRAALTELLPLVLVTREAEAAVKRARKAIL